MNQIQRNARHAAFTLIELLIVVAIIAILAAIAVPNFLEAQTRAKVSRAQSDLRTTALGLESYYVDNNGYPRSNLSSRFFNPPSKKDQVGRYGFTLERLTTPIAYLTGEDWAYDPFKGRATYQGTLFEDVKDITAFSANDEFNFQMYWYCARNTTQSAIWTDQDEDPKWWAIESAGPDGYHHNLGTGLNAMVARSESEYQIARKIMYEKTNGLARQHLAHRRRRRQHPARLCLL